MNLKISKTYTVNIYEIRMHPYKCTLGTLAKLGTMQICAGTSGVLGDNFVTRGKDLAWDLLEFPDMSPQVVDIEDEGKPSTTFYPNVQ